MNSQKVLSKYSDKELIKSVAAIGRKETESTAELLLHLAEIDSRRLYLKQGYSSLFDFCHRGPLRYSEGAAQRRIVAARAISRFPRLLEFFVSKEINLCTLALIAPVLTEESFLRHIKAISGKSKREVEEYLASCRPGKEVRESIKPVYVASKKQAAVKTTPLFEAQSAKKPRTAATGGGDLSNNSVSLAEQMFDLHYQIKGTVMKKYREAQALLSSKYPKGFSMEVMLDELLELYLEINSPQRRQKRREARAEKKKAVSRCSGKRVLDEQSGVSTSRHIPQEIKDLVYIRDGAQCTYVSPDGVRCGCGHNLHIDHIVPYTVSHDNSLSNLRLLCSAHNGYQAELFFGKACIDKYLHKKS